jgi:hypothetical protein
MKINISNDVRAFATEQGLPIGKRGKIATEVKVAYLADKPEVTRLLAEANGVEINTRGKLSAESIEAVAKSFA